MSDFPYRPGCCSDYSDTDLAEWGARKQVEAALDKLSVGKTGAEIDWGINVSEKTAERCLRILEWYFDDHPEKVLMAETSWKDDKIRMRITNK